MKLDRTNGGRSKYALVRLRGIEGNSEADRLLQRLEELGHIDFGHVGAPDEFFVIKLRDLHALPALASYSRSASLDDPEYSREVLGLANRAGVLNPYRKKPD